jgi:uncharacterized membrane protein
VTTVLERSAAPNPTPDPVGPAPRRYAAVPFVILGHALVLLDVAGPVRPVVGIGVLLGVPMLVLLRRVSWRTDDATAPLLYSFGLTVLGAIFAGLALNTALPPLGVERPLDRVPIAISSMVLDLALLLWRPRVRLGPDGGWGTCAGRLLRARFEGAQSLAVGSLVLGVIGAIRLNNGGSGAVAVTGHCLAVLAMLTLLVSRRHDRGRDVRTILLVSAALLYATSLRGWFITGHDIQREYIAFLLTNGGAHWTMGPFQSPYNACLSVNILPTLIAQITGLSGIVVFKVVMQAAMVVVPVATYVYARRAVERGPAVVSAIALMAFPTFFNDMPYLVRQEVAFLFLALLVLAATETRWGIARRRLVALAFGAGVVVSHYSTTYVLLIALSLGTAAWLLLLVRRLRWGRQRRPDREPGRAVLLSVAMVVPLAAFSAVWTGPVTHTGGHMEETARQTLELIVNGGGQPGSSDLSYGLFAGRQATPRARMDLYVKQSMEERRVDGSADRLVQDPSAAVLKPEILKPENLPVTALGRSVTDLGVNATSVNAALRLGSAGLLQVLLLIGLAALILRSRFARGFSPEVRWLNIGVLGALAAVVVLPGLSVSYGVLRAFEQSLLVTAPLLALGTQVLVAPLRRLAGIAVALLWSGVFATLVGVVPSLLGGSPGQLALANSGLYYDLYLVQDQEVAAAQWLDAVSRSSPVQAEVISDKVTVTRMQSYLGAEAVVHDEFFPTELRKGNYVFLGPETLSKDQATIFYTGNLISYRYPINLLDHRLDVVYSSPLARVYR